MKEWFPEFYLPDKVRDRFDEIMVETENMVTYPPYRLDYQETFNMCWHTGGYLRKALKEVGGAYGAHLLEHAEAFRNDKILGMIVRNLPTDQNLPSTPHIPNQKGAIIPKKPSYRLEWSMLAMLGLTGQGIWKTSQYIGGDTFFDILTTQFDFQHTSSYRGEAKMDLHCDKATSNSPSTIVMGCQRPAKARGRTFFVNLLDLQKRLDKSVLGILSKKVFITETFSGKKVKLSILEYKDGQLARVRVRPYGGMAVKAEPGNTLASNAYGHYRKALDILYKQYVEWEPGTVVISKNFLTAHGRESFIEPPESPEGRWMVRAYGIPEQP